MLSALNDRACGLSTGHAWEITMFDAKCYGLAEYFLPADASEGMKDALAQAVQDAVEDWLSGTIVEQRAEIEQTIEQMREARQRRN